MEIVIAIVIVALVAAFVGSPFRRGPDGRGLDSVPTDDPRRADLEARKQAKYREIRDTELDHAQGKLSRSDFGRQQAELRAEAIEILKSIDALEAESGGGEADPERSRPPAGEAEEPQSADEHV